jgi:hypothetical protein
MTTTVLRDTTVLPEIDAELAESSTTAPTRTRAGRAAAIVSMRLAGSTPSQIAKALHEHGSYVGRVLRRHGLTGLPNVEREARDAEILRRRLLLGQSFRTIEREMKLRSRGTVPSVLARAGQIGVALPAEAERRRQAETDARRADREEATRQRRALEAEATRQRRLARAEAKAEEARQLHEAKAEEAQQRREARAAERTALREARDKRIVALFAAGEPVSAVAEQLRVSHRTVSRVVEAAGVETRRRSCNVCGEAFEFQRSCGSGAPKRCPTCPRPSRRSRRDRAVKAAEARAARDQRIVELHAAGENLDAIAAATGVHRRTAFCVLRRDRTACRHPRSRVRVPLSAVGSARTARCRGRRYRTRRPLRLRSARTTRRRGRRRWCW